MWNIGERIVCVNHKFNGLVLNRTYTVTKHNPDDNAVWVDNLKHTGFIDTQFISLIDFRKQKIEKIKERICGKKVI